MNVNQYLRFNQKVSKGFHMPGLERRYEYRTALKKEVVAGVMYVTII